MEGGIKSIIDLDVGFCGSAKLSHFFLVDEKNNFEWQELFRKSSDNKIKIINDCLHLTFFSTNCARRKSIYALEVDLRTIFFVKSQSPVLDSFISRFLSCRRKNLEKQELFQKTSSDKNKFTKSGIFGGFFAFFGFFGTFRRFLTNNNQ